MEALTSLAGNYGTFYLTGTSAKAIRFIGFKVETEATLSALLQSAGDVRANYFTSAGATLPAGLIVKAQGEIPFTSITLATGTVTLILEG